MPNTERLYSQRDEAATEEADIRERAQRMKDNIRAMIVAFADDHVCSATSVAYALDYTADALVDLIDDATGPAFRRRVRLDEEIGAIEEADLHRSTPVVL